MDNQSSSRKRKFLFSLILILFPLLVIGLIGEMIVRKNPSLIEEVASPPYDSRIVDKDLGWITKEGYNYNTEWQDKYGVKYPLNLSFKQYGFRSWGDPNSSKKKILFVGDSYTQCVEVSDDKTYHSIINDSLKDVEVFAYGVAGYGTYQQLKLIDRYFSIINPDVLVIQMCTNDYTDNYYPLEELSNYKVNKRRPYLTKEGKEFYYTTGPCSKWMKEYSYFLAYLCKRYENMRGLPKPTPIDELPEKIIPEKGLEYPLYKESYETTSRILKEIHDKYSGKVKLVSFIVDGFPPFAKDLVDLSLNNKIDTLAFAGKRLEAIEYFGGKIRTADGYHLNEEGQRQLAHILLPKLKEAIK